VNAGFELKRFEAVTEHDLDVAEVIFIKAIRAFAIAIAVMPSTDASEIAEVMVTSAGLRDELRRALEVQRQPGGVLQ